jgi:hypothetical protein
MRFLKFHPPGAGAKTKKRLLAFVQMRAAVSGY